MSDINEKDNEILGKDLTSHDADDIEALAESMADSDSSVSAEEKKSNRKKLKEQLLIEAGLGKSIIDKNLDLVMHESMMPYSEHVILDRALPRVEDGLKPVQRRILYSMNEQGLTPDKPYKKSAKVVGDCLAKYHPHGDSSVYDAMVRLAQPFNMKETLVDGQGNFGSVDGDSAAAMRYTEARMTPIALEILRDLDKNTVDWMLTYDDSMQEPKTLPCRFPNVLVNGASGIAVGLATNIPTHNLSECIAGACALIDNPDMTLKEMMKIIKAPDFPTGGYIIAGEELEKAYETGKGKILIRAKAHIEGGEGDKKNIVITELPYQVNKAVLLQKIAELRESKKDILGGITEIADESDREGMRAVIRVKKDADPKKILEYLFKYTQLQVSFGINMVVIAGGRPEQLGLIPILKHYVAYQRDVIYRRTKFDLDAAKEREHILRGLIIAVRNIDEVVQIIKKSASPAEAKTKLRARFELSDVQAQAILDMRLARLTSLEIFKLETELLELEKKIRELTAIVGSKKLQFDIVKEEMQEIRRKYKDARKSDIIATVDDYVVPAQTNEKPIVNVVVTYSESGFIKAMNAKHVSMCSKAWGEKSIASENYTSMVSTSTDKTILAFTNLGNAYKIDPSLLGDYKWKDKGLEFVKAFNADKREKVVFMYELGSLKEDQNLLFFTKAGMIKKTAVSEYMLLKAVYQAVKLKDGDELLTVEVEKPESTIMFVTKEGMCLNALTDDIPLQGRVSGGVKGIMLSDTDSCVMISQVNAGDLVAVVTNKGYAKKVLSSEIDKLARYRKGVKIIDLKGDSSNGSSVVGAGIEKENMELVIVTDEEASAINFSSVTEDTRSSKGSKLGVSKNNVASVNVRYVSVDAHKKA